MDDLDMSDWSDARLEVALSDYANPPERGAAKAEIAKRQRKHELDRDEHARQHDIALGENYRGPAGPVAFPVRPRMSPPPGTGLSPSG
jgi:hypothetical protein